MIFGWAVGLDVLSRKVGLPTEPAPRTEGRPEVLRFRSNERQVEYLGGQGVDLSQATWSEGTGHGAHSRSLHGPEGMTIFRGKPRPGGFHSTSRAMDRQGVFRMERYRFQERWAFLVNMLVSAKVSAEMLQARKAAILGLLATPDLD